MAVVRNDVHCAPTCEQFLQLTVRVGLVFVFVLV